MADNNPPPACPVDHKARDAWLAQARAADHRPVDHQPKSWSQTLAAYLPWRSSSSDPAPPGPLGTSRVVSSIPRSAAAAAVAAAAPPDACPVGHGASANPEPAAHWVYPSEKMFFDAMRRKGYAARPADMKTVVPIHNAVNERAWKHIQDWEAPYLHASSCGGPKLESFANNDRMTPTARLNTLLGYAPPFDRHDWVIDRCGTRVEYVIDFYAGRSDGRPGPSFYLDVRPKLNSWEGVKMRALRWVGLA